MAENTTPQQNLVEAPIPPARLHHIAFRTARSREMREFYMTFLGVHPILEVEGFATFFTFDQAHHRLVLFYNSACTAPGPLSQGMHHVAFEHDSVDDLMCVYQRLKRQGIRPHLVMDHGPTLAAYYHDPDGNSIELQIDNFGSDPRKSLEAMQALQASPNPFGSVVNLETYLAAWQAGATLAELHERAYQGEFAEGAEPLPPPSEV